MDLMDLYAQKNALTEEAEGILAKAESESRDLTAEEDERFGEIQAEVATLEGKIQRAAWIDGQKKKAGTVGDRRSAPDKTTNPEALVDGKIGGNDVGKVKDAKDEDRAMGFADFGEFALSVRRQAVSGTVDDRLSIGAGTASGLNQSVGSEGGYLVPPAFSDQIYDGLNASADNLLNFTDNYTVPSGADSLTFPANAETSRATGSRFGGVQGYWISEADQITSSTPKLRQMKLEPQQLAVLVYATDKLLRNGGGALTQYLTRAATEEIQFLTGDSIINGTGAGQPVGCVGHNSVVSIAKETGQAGSTIVKENIDKMWARCHARARMGAVWFINQDIEPQLENLSLTVGTGGMPVYLPAGGIADSPNARLKGRPVIPIEYCSTLGTVGDIILANMSFYAVGLRGGVDSAMSIHLRFDYLETAFRFVFEVDGQPWMAEALTPFKGTNTLSPIVTLATRA